MVTLDFRDCKNVDDVNKVFKREDSALKNASAMMDRVKNPQNYCPKCEKFFTPKEDGLSQSWEVER